MGTTLKRSWKALAVVIVFVSMLALALFAVIRTARQEHDRSDLLMCQSMLTNLAFVVQQYRRENHDLWPASLANIDTGDDLGIEAFTCPAVKRQNGLPAMMP